jgi:hypothetical protein
MITHSSSTLSFPMLSQLIPRPKVSATTPQDDAGADKSGSSGNGSSSISTREDLPVATPFQRHVRQLGLFMAGAGFLAASVAITRRSVIRMRADTFPSFYASNRNPTIVNSSDRGLIAVRALGLATLNVVSFGIMLVGGISWGFDLVSLSELRQRTRLALSRPTGLSAEDEKQAEEQMEKMMDDLMSRLGMKKPEPEPETKAEPVGKDGGEQ